MSEWKPQIVKIEKVEKHSDADALDIATVLGDYPVIVKRGEYQVGDLAAYINIDTIVPDVEAYYFLCPRSYEKYTDESGEIKQRAVGSKYSVGSVPERHRVIRAKRIRGIYSQGMLVPAPEGLNVGDSVAEILQLQKVEEDNEDNIVSPKMRGANAESPPKGWAIPYYDIEGIRKYLSCVEAEQDVILSEKLNGSNAGFCHDGEKLWVKSRNWYKRFDSEDPWHDAATRHNLQEKLAKYPMLVFFAELVNQVKGFRYSAEIIDGKLQTQLYFFDIWDTKTSKYLDFDTCEAIIAELDLAMPPLLYRGKWLSKDEMYAFAEGTSTLNPKVVREGWVLRLGKERYESRVDGRCQFKLISQGYNLAK